MQHSVLPSSPPTPIEADAAVSGIPWAEREPLTITVSYQTRQALDRLARGAGMSRAQYVRAVLDTHVALEVD